MCGSWGLNTLAHRVWEPDKEIAGPVHAACGHVVDKPGQCWRSFTLSFTVQHQLKIKFWAPSKYPKKSVSAVQLSAVLVAHIEVKSGPNYVIIKKLINCWLFSSFLTKLYRTLQYSMYTKLCRTHHYSMYTKLCRTPPQDVHKVVWDTILQYVHKTV